MRQIILQLLILVSLGAEAATVNLAGRKVDVPIPDEYCQFGKRIVDIELARVLLSELGNDNQVLAFFADCDELDAYRHGSRASLDNFGLVFAQKRNGVVTPIPGRSRQEFVRETGGAIVANTADAVKAGESQARLMLTRGNLTLQAQQPFRLQADENGAYFGIAGEISDGPGKRSPVLGVLGITLVKELFLSIEIYQRFSSAPPVAVLLERQQAAMAKLITGNQLTPGSALKKMPEW